MKKYIFLFIFFAGIAGGFAVLRFYLYCATPYRSSPPVLVTVSIPDGSSLTKISRILEDKGLIRGRFFFTLLGKLKKAEHRIKAGEYLMRLPLAPRDILDKLIRGEVMLISVTVPEGSTVFDIARIIQTAGFCSADAVLQKATDPAFVKPFGLDNESLEGFLFPDTYKFGRKAGIELILSKMVARFKEIFEREVKKAQSGPQLSVKQTVTLASLVESETPRAEEKPVIAGVFYNRLKKNMRLECDPTVLYGVRLEDPLFQGRLRKKHLQKATRYNTYQIFGLPCGPICNPGLDSITAAVRPADVDYLFFVSKNNGTHQFSRSLEEHNRAVNQYQRGR